MYLIFPTIYIVLKKIDIPAYEAYINDLAKE